MHHAVTVLWAGGLLCGCAAGTQTATTTHEAEPDCSFRSPTTCWTVSGRFPATPRKPAAQPERNPPQAPAVLASGADTVR
jgi:hypothetical protein